MAVKLSAKNFQSWEDVNLTIEGLTVLVGPGDLGKSALFRALRGLLRNELSVNQVRVAGEAMEVEAVIDGVTVLAKRKRKGSTTYAVGGVDYAKLGGSVPDALKDLKFEEIVIGDGKLDPIFATQFGGQFLLQESPTALNSILGAFSSTEKLEFGKREANSRIAEKNAQAKALAVEARLVEDRRSRLEVLSLWANGIQATIDEVDPAVRRQEKALAAMAALAQQLERVGRIRSALEKVKVPAVDAVVSGIHLMLSYRLNAANLERYNRTHGLLARLIVPNPDPVTLEMKQATALATACVAVSVRNGLSSVLKRIVIPDAAETETHYRISVNAALAAAATERLNTIGKCNTAVDSVIKNWTAITKIYKIGKSLSDAGAARASMASSPAKERLKVIAAHEARVAELVSSISHQQSVMSAMSALRSAAQEVKLKAASLVSIEKACTDAQLVVVQVEEAAGLKECPNCGEQIQIGVIHHDPIHRTQNLTN